jgi:hypothetical protein
LQSISVSERRVDDLPIGRYVSRQCCWLRARHKPNPKETEDDIYEEVSEAEYRKIVKKRLDQDDFVVDDGVDGYADHGMDDWDREDSDREREETRRRTKSSGLLP